MKALLHETGEVLMGIESEFLWICRVSKLKKSPQIY